MANIMERIMRSWDRFCKRWGLRVPTLWRKTRKAWLQNPVVKDEVQGKEEARFTGFVDFSRDFSRERWGAMAGFC